MMKPKTLDFSAGLKFHGKVKWVEKNLEHFHLETRSEKEFWPRRIDVKNLAEDAISQPKPRKDHLDDNRKCTHWKDLRNFYFEVEF